jgi:hypothetical protein
VDSGEWIASLGFLVMDVWHGTISESVWAQKVGVQRTRYLGVLGRHGGFMETIKLETKHDLLLLCYRGCFLLLS